MKLHVLTDPCKAARLNGHRGIRCRALFVLVLFCVALPVAADRVDVQVTGLEGTYQTNALALLGIQQESEGELGEARIRALHGRAPDQIRDALAPFGLYRVEVDASLTPPSAEGTPWTARYAVAPGDPIRIATVDYEILGEGATNPEFPTQFPLGEGAVLLHADYEKAKGEILAIAQREGYLDANLPLHRVLIDVTHYRAIIQFHLDTGPRYYIGDVRFKQDLLAEDLLERYVDFEVGDLYDPDKLLGLQSRLLGTEYYEKVEIDPLKEDAGESHVIPIEVIAVRNKANKYRFGLGYATDVGPRATLEWRRRYLNRWGHRFKAEANASEVSQGVEFDYRIPIADPTTDYVTIRPDWESFNTASRSGEVLTVKFGHSVLLDSGWRRTMGVDYRNESTEINSQENIGTTNELVPNISFARTYTDDPIYTSNGYRVKFTLLGTTQALSETTYFSALLRAKWIKSFLDDYRFITRADLGATLADDVLDVPVSRRFFAGGDDTVRGWSFDVLGPNDPVTNDAVGGRYLAVGSLELERRIKGDFSAAVFTDFGNAFDPAFEREIEVGAGAGIRWRSPIGQIRFDIAFALTKTDSPARLHFVIGPDL